MQEFIQQDAENYIKDIQRKKTSNPDEVMQYIAPH
jgi:hypothetical protein